MSEPGVLERRTVPSQGANGAGPDRAVRRRRGLPTGRAVVGGLLIAVAAVAVFAAYLDATAAPTTTFVVATSQIDPGQRVEASDLGTIALDLPGDVQGGVVADPEVVIGAVATAPIAPGELIRPSAIVDTDAAVAAPQISFAVSSSRALGDRIRPGERIDLLATYGSAGGGSYTMRVLADVLVVARHTPGGGDFTTGGSASVVFTVALDDPDDALAVAHAIDTAEVTVVRSTGTTAAPQATYRPEAPGDDAG